MGGFNWLSDLFREQDKDLQPTLSLRRGWGRVNQWMETDAEELAKTLADNGCNATLCEFLGFSEANHWQDMARLYGQAEAFAAAMRHRGIWTHWTAVNWNMGGGGVSENGDATICDGRFSDAWFADILGHLSAIIGEYGGDLLPCSELGVRNAGCRAKGLRWHEMARGAVGTARLRWNGNGDASPTSSPGGETIEYHINGLADRGYRPGSFVADDTSKALNELGGLRNYVSRHDALTQLTREVRAKGGEFCHYGFSTPGIDYRAVETIGRA